MAVIFVIAVSIRLTLAWTLCSPGIVSKGEAESIARTLAETGEFGGAYLIPTGPTAHCGPFYVGLLSLIYRFFGSGTTVAENIRIGLLIGVNSICTALLPVVAPVLGLPLWAGIAAGMTSALVPMHRTAEAFHAWDEPYAVLGLMVALMLLARWKPLHRSPFYRSAWYGLLWGVLLQVAATTLPVLLGLAVFSIAENRAQAWPELRRWAVVFAAATVVMLPWTLRNRVQLGEWIFIRSNFGLELRISNNDRAGATNFETGQAGLYRDTHPGDSLREAQRLRDLGEIAYHRSQVTQALSWIHSHPGHFAALTAVRIRVFWLGSWRNPETACVLSITTILAIAGLWLMWRDGLREAFWMFVIVWLCYPLTFYVVQHLTRYRMPMWWTVVLPAVYATGRFFGSWRARILRRPDAFGVGDPCSRTGPND
jgi:hypothetical protein